MTQEDIIKYFADEPNSRERIELMQAIEKDDELQELFIAYRNVNGLIALSSRPDDRKVGEADYKQFVRDKNSHRRKKLFARIVGYAATVALLVGGAWVAAHFYYDNHQVTEYNTITASSGNFTLLTLGDGTEVWLNAHSSLRYPAVFDKDKREVELRGEAYFRVAKNAERPFTVSTPSLDVKALGTTFNVKCDSLQATTDVSLIEGSVAVMFGGNTRDVILKPMQNLHLAGEKITVTTMANDDGFLWKDGIIVFDELSLTDIVKKIEWCYDTKIIISNTDAANDTYSGKFRLQDGPYEILRILQKGRRFKLQKNDENNILEIK
jgi:ferric-dicitrate binding protein FerR (iron transport regulator)